jgi:hypothetical protein
MQKIVYAKLLRIQIEVPRQLRDKNILFFINDSVIVFINMLGMKKNIKDPKYKAHLTIAFHSSDLKV